MENPQRAGKLALYGSILLLIGCTRHATLRENVSAPAKGEQPAAFAKRGPMTLAECSARNITDIANAIDTDEFRKLVRKLKKTYAIDYSSRILAPTGRIEVPSMLSEMMKGF